MSLNYAKYDFSDLLAQLRGLMEKTGSYDSVGTLVGYYTERRAEESYLLTARNRSSLLNLAALVGYQAQLRTSASATAAGGTVTVYISKSESTAVAVNRGTVLKTADGVKFYVTETTSITPGDTSVNVSVIQGTLATRNQIYSTSAAGFTITLSDANIEATPPRVIVGATDWTWVSSFKGYGPTDTVYKTQVNSDDTVSIVFGDNVRGAIPTGYPTAITVEYTISDGASGNVTTVGALSTVETTLYAGGSSVTAWCDNTAEIVGGADIESNDDIRDLAPAVFSTGDRAVTAADCRAIANTADGVVDSYFWGEYDVSPGSPDYDLMNRVYFCVVDANGDSPASQTDPLVVAVEDLLRSKGMMSVWYVYEQASSIDILVQVKVRATATTNLTTLESNISTYIQNQFLVGSTTLLGTDKYHSVLEAGVQGMSGVIYSHVDMYVKQTVVNKSGNTWGVTSPFGNLLAGSVQVFVNGVLAATDDGDGTLTFNISGYSAGAYNVGTGAVTFTHVGTPPAPCYILHQQDNTADGQNRDLVLGPKQLATLDSVQFI
jgi:hypothetical protein